jgi:hypothetical protein
MDMLFSKKIYFILLIFINSLAIAEDPSILDNFRIRRLHNISAIKEAHLDFIKKTESMMSSPVEATPDKIVQFEDSQTFFRKMHPKSTPHDDIIDFTCRNDEIREKENNFLKERKQFADFLVEKEKTLRIASLLNTTFLNWSSKMKELAKTFATTCGLNEKCLEKKQLDRQTQIHATAIAHWNLAYLEGLIINSDIKDTLVKERLKNIAEKAVAKTEAELHRQIDAVASRKDLPW